ncbi:MAG: GNAT family N-acetyltransferase [Acidobacteriota bacterium]|jgi:predicted GNAT superfamily acetyltransferase
MGTVSTSSSDPDRSARLVLRRLRSPEDLDACVELQKLVWGEGFADLTPPALLRIAEEVGGVSAGAFGPDGRLEGFVFGISGLRDGVPAHWSHMMAVRPESRGRGLGIRLKAHQRRVLLERGIGTAFWTYDPLVARNAHLNVVRLGALPVEYKRDYYGSGDDSALSAGIGTDRFVVRWDLASDRVERALAGEAPEPAEEEVQAPILEDLAEDAPPAFRVEIPGDVQAVRDADPERAAAWRASTRRALEPALARGYRVASVLRTGEGSGAAVRERFFYLLTRPGDRSRSGPCP